MQPLAGDDLLDALPYAVYVARPTGELVSVSSRIADLTGYPRERFLAEPGFFSSVVHVDDRAARERALRELRPGHRACVEYRIVKANGLELACVADHLQLRMSDGPQATLVGMLVDLRDRKFIEAAAKEAARLASLGELAAGVAHEVNNPLSGVLNYAQLAKRILQQPGAFPPGPAARLVEPLEGILAEAERILEITKTLVSFARRPEEETFRAIAVHELVRATLTITKQRLKECSIAIDVDVPPDLPAIRARGHELSQVLQHLVANAYHALNARFPRWDPQKRIAFRASRLEGDAQWPAGFVRIEVQDKGCGIAPENLPRVFLPFFTTRPQGTGLGLATSREIVLAHGGRMDVTSAPGEGTTISFTVPVY